MYQQLILFMTRFQIDHIGYSGGGGYGSSYAGVGGSNGSKGKDGSYGKGGAGSGVQIDNIPITNFVLRYALLVSQNPKTNFD